MRAKLVKEALGDILKPRSKEEVLKSFIGKDPDKVMETSYSTMDDAAQLLGIRWAIENGASRERIQATLHYAIEDFRNRVVKLIMDTVPDPDTYKNYDNLGNAVAVGNEEAVKILLTNKVDFRKLIDLATINKRKKVLQILIDYINNRNR